MTIFEPSRPLSARIRRGVAQTALAAALFVGGYYAHMVVTSNFHPVIKGEVYRSSQPTASNIAMYQKEYGIKTILNLRGPNSGRDWYDAEVAQAKSLNIQHIDFPMSARRELTQEEAEKLVALMRDAPKPLLIHCQAGSDRTGLASALYLAAIAKTSEATAEGQISIFYGHIGVPLLSKTYAMDRTFENMEPWLGLSNS
jgi:protein tyrosine/serine phosphatase